MLSRVGSRMLKPFADAQSSLGRLTTKVKKVMTYGAAGIAVAGTCYVGHDIWVNPEDEDRNLSGILNINKRRLIKYGGPLTLESLALTGKLTTWEADEVGRRANLDKRNNVVNGLLLKCQMPSRKFVMNHLDSLSTLKEEDIADVVHNSNLSENMIDSMPTYYNYFNLEKRFIERHEIDSFVLSDDELMKIDPTNWLYWSKHAKEVALKKAGYTVSNDNVKAFKAVKPTMRSIFGISTLYAVGQTYTTQCDFNSEDTMTEGYYGFTEAKAHTFAQENWGKEYIILKVEIPIEDVCLTKDGKVRGNVLKITSKVGSFGKKGWGAYIGLK